MIYESTSADLTGLPGDLILDSKGLEAAVRKVAELRETGHGQHTIAVEVIRAYLGASPSIESRAGAVAVKPLDWRPGSVLNRYVADVFDKPMYRVGFDQKWYWAHEWLGASMEYVDTLEAAKAGAQTDYEARIQSALVTTSPDSLAL